MTDPFPLTAEAGFRDGTAEVIIRGDIDLTATAALEDILAFVLSKEPHRVLLDLSAVGFLDCAAARAIAHAAQALPSGQLIVRDPSLPAYRVLQVTGQLALIADDSGRTGTHPGLAALARCRQRNRQNRGSCSDLTTSPPS